MIYFQSSETPSEDRTGDISGLIDEIVLNITMVGALKVSTLSHTHIYPHTDIYNTLIHPHHTHTSLHKNQPMWINNLSIYGYFNNHCLPRKDNLSWCKSGTPDEGKIQHAANIAKCYFIASCPDSISILVLVRCLYVWLISSA